MALTGRMMLWMNAVGGYWVCLADAVVLGRVAAARQPQAAAMDAAGGPDIPILADLSSRHARIRRDGEGHLLEALRQVRLDGRPVRGTTWLSDGGRIELGEGVKLLFRRPHPYKRHRPAGIRQPSSHASGGRRRAPAWPTPASSGRTPAAMSSAAAGRGR